MSSALLVVGLLGCSHHSDDRSTTASHAAMSADHSLAGHGAVDVSDDDDFKGCPDGIPGFAPGLQAKGDRMALKVVAAMPAEPERYINEWTVELGSLNGSPAPDAELERAQTFMPIHGHDGGVQPRMTVLSEPAQVHVGGLNFTMRGPWEVRFWLRSASMEDDYIVFKVCVAK